MAERYPGDSAAKNGFGRRHLHEDEARRLFEANYPAPPDMRVPRAWRLSAGGVPVPPLPTGAERRSEIARICSSLSEEHRNRPNYALDSHNLWTMYFERRHADLIESFNGVIPRGRHNADRRREWWGVPGCTLEAVLDYIETGNTPRLEYPAPPSFFRRRGSSWTPRRMDAGTSSSSGSSPVAHPVKPEPQETAQESPLGRRTRSGALTIRGGGGPRSLRLVRPRTEPEPELLPVKPELLPVKPEHVEMAAADETAMKWARDDYVREQVARQRRAYEELKARHIGREEDDVIVLNDDDEAGPSRPPRVGDPGQGCSRDGGSGGPQDGDDDDDDSRDYTDFYRRLDM